MPASSAASWGSSSRAQKVPRAFSSQPWWYAWKYVRAAASIP